MNSKQMSLGTMMVLLVIAIALMPLFKNTMASVSGFQDIQVPAAASGAGLPVIRDYTCRSPNNDNVPCPEGTFCDGSRQICEKRYIGNSAANDIVGYYA